MDGNINKNKITAGIFWSYSERFFAQGIALIVSIILAIILDPDDYGIVAIVLIFITICDALVTGGFGNALVQKKDSNEADFNTVFWFSILISFVLYLILFLCAPLIAFFYDKESLILIVRIFGIRIVFSAINSVQQAYVQKNMLFKKFFVATIIGTIISGVVGVIVAINGGGVWALIIQQMLNTIMDTILLYFIIDWKPKFYFSIKSLSSVWLFGIKMLSSTMVYTIKDNIRSLIIGKRYSSADLAYYNQGMKYPQLAVTDLVSSLGKVLFPALSSRQENRTEIKQMMRKAISVSTYIVAPIILGLFAVGDTFFQAIFPDKWLPAVPYLRIISLVYITRTINMVFQKAILAIGKSEIVLYYEILTSSTTIILLLLAVFCFNSIPLIAWSYVFVEFLGTIFYAIIVHKDYQYSYREMTSDYFVPVSLAAMMAVAVIGIGFIDILAIVKLIIQIILGLFLYLFLSRITCNKAYRYLVNQLQSFLKNRKALKG